MIINILDNQKILKDKFDLSLPDFTVLTGENGSGKTQLLESLRESMIYYDRFQRLEHQNPIENHKMVFPITDNNGSELNHIIYSSPGLMDNENAVSFQKPLIQQIREQWNILMPIARSYSFIKNTQFENEQSELQALNNAISQFVKNLTTDPKRFSASNLKKASLHQLQHLKKISLKANKSIDELYFIDFIIFYSVPTNLFSSALDLLFHQFHLKQKYYPNLTDGVTPPWDVFNQILLKANFKYKAQYTPSNNEELPQPVKLIDNEKGINSATFNTLSSGEKTIMSLIFVLYHASSNGKFPQVILFDEPDAHLHPSLTKLFLSVISKVLVEEQNVKVILTTHSPSTIALSPDKAIYRMDRNLGYPIKEKRNTAVQTLSNGLASLTFEDGNFGITYNLKKTNKHIVFTEGVTDKIIIELAWKKLYANEEMPFLIQDSFSASFLGSLFNQGDQKPDGIFIQFPERKLIALFDFDSAGYSNWNRKKKFPTITENNPRKCLVRTNGKNGYLLLLPVSEQQPIKDLVIKNHNETFKDKSNLTIESLFLNAPNFMEEYFEKESVIGGGSLFLFKKDKREFALNLEDLDPKYFNEFIPLFEQIINILKN
ncbi:MAG: ATP-binding protein [Bacteroidota bacterium]|nr:ATP-binding protein [Bacteroidota bacterium]MEE3243637.1 ATP-binding protein [Bacteroidota bacterium]